MRRPRNIASKITCLFLGHIYNDKPLAPGQIDYRQCLVCNKAKIDMGMSAISGKQFNELVEEEFEKIKAERARMKPYHRWLVDIRNNYSSFIEWLTY